MACARAWFGVRAIATPDSFHGFHGFPPPQRYRSGGSVQLPRHVLITTSRELPVKATTNKPAQRPAGAGLRIEPIPARPPRRTEDGRIAVPLWVLRDEKHLGDAE